MLNYDTVVSIFPHARSNKPNSEFRIADILADIQEGGYAKQVEAIRGEQDKAKRDELKKKLPAVTWSGIFSKRNANSLVNYSGIICIDIDALHIDQVKHYKKSFSQDANVMACFVSPSGNGLKLLFLHNAPAESHELVFLALQNYLDTMYSVEVDKTGKDICRLCFLSYDKDLYYNAQASPLTKEFLKDHAPKPQSKMYVPDGFEPMAAKATTFTGTDATDNIAKAHKVTEKTVTAGPGTYNKYINCFALHANRYGISEADALYEMLSYCSAHDEKDTRTVVAHVYKKWATEHGQYNQGKHTPRTDTKPAKKPKKVDTDSPTHSTTYDTTILFWYAIEKSPAQTTINEKGEVITVREAKHEFKFSYNRYIKFLENNGFYKLRVNRDKYQLIRIDRVNNIVDVADDLAIKEFVIGFLLTEADSDLEYEQVLELYRRGVKSYNNMGVLEGLQYYSPAMKGDTEDTAYVYFSDCYIEVSAAGIAHKQYSELDGYIWRKQIIDKPFTPHDYKTYRNCDFYRFMLYAITGHKADKEGVELNDVERIKMRSVYTTIGYMLHQYKNPAVTKAVIAVDKKLRNTGEANGRSGKSLFSKALGHMLPMTMIDGPNFKFDYEFAFQNVSVDTRLINFNDVAKNFPFDRLFGMITEDFTFNKKKIDGITIPFADAPKFYISTNYTLRGEGESNKGRQQIIEFSTYFNTGHTPIQEFGRLFFSKSWDAEQWSMFYSFFIDCVRIYLKDALIDFPLENYAHNKLIDTTGEDFIEFMDEQLLKKQHEPASGGLLKFDAGLLYDEYVQLTKFVGRRNTFTKWIRMWAEVYEYEINAHTNGQRDRSNGHDYFTFTAKAPAVKTDEAANVPAGYVPQPLNFTTEQL